MAFDLLAPFTGAPQQQATADIQANIARQRQVGLGLGQTNLTGGLAALQSGQTAGVGAIGAGNTAASGYLTPAIGGATSALYGGQAAGAGALTGGAASGLAALQGGVGGANDAYNTLLTNTGAGDSSTSDYVNRLLGIGPAGTGGPFAYSPTDPGYQFRLAQARKTALAGANAAGMAPGGNTLASLEQLGSNYANQAYQQDVQNALNLLQTRGQIGSTAASGKANAALTGGTGAANIDVGTGKSLADLYSNTGSNVANVALGGGTTLANLAQNAGLAEGSLYGTTGANAANLYGANTGQAYGLIEAGYTPYANAADASAQAQEQGPLNLFNLGINATKAVAGLPAGTISKPLSNLNLGSPFLPSSYGTMTG